MSRDISPLALAFSYSAVIKSPQGRLLQGRQSREIGDSTTLILDFTMTYTRYGRSIQHTTGQLTHTRSSDGAPELDGAL